MPTPHISESYVRNAPRHSVSAIGLIAVACDELHPVCIVADPPAQVSAMKVPKRLIDRARPALRKYQEILEPAKAREVGASHTRVIVSVVLTECPRSRSVLVNCSLLSHQPTNRVTGSGGSYSRRATAVSCQGQTSVRLASGESPPVFSRCLSRGNREVNRKRGCLRLCVVLLIGVGGTVEAQNRSPSATSPPPCVPCAVTLRPILTLSSAAVAMVEGRPTLALRTPSGAILLYQRNRPRIQVFDQSGTSRGLLAPIGAGPGELQRPLWMAYGDDDTLRIIEARRMLIFDANLRYAREEVYKTPLGASIADWVRLTEGMSAYLPGSGQPGQPQRLSIRRSNGDTAATMVLRDTVSAVVTYQLAAHRARPGGFWIARASMDSVGYRIAWVDTLGRALPAYSGTPPWWHRTPKPEPAVVWRVPRGGGRPVASRDSSELLPRPSTLLIDLRARPDQTILVLAAHPRDPWGRVTLGNVAWIGATRTVVEVIDPKAGRSLGSVQVDGYPIGFLNDESIATYREVENGEFFLDFWRLVITPP